MARLLTTASTILCAHGGTAVLSTDNSHVSAGARVLLESDTHTVVGCGFTTSEGDSFCQTIEWAGGATRVKVGGTAPLHDSSLGTCKNSEGVAQGTAIVVVTQPRVNA